MRKIAVAKIAVEEFLNDLFVDIRTRIQTKTDVPSFSVMSRPHDPSQAICEMEYAGVIEQPAFLRSIRPDIIGPGANLLRRQAEREQATEEDVALLAFTAESVRDDRAP